MLVTWTVLRVRAGAQSPPWTPAGASWWQAGYSSPGAAQPPENDGVWWSVLAGWYDAAAASAEPRTAEDVDAWHVVLEPLSAHGDVVLSGGIRPFDDLLGGATPHGPAVLITVAGSSADEGREREFFRRFMHVSREIGSAPGHVVSMVQAPVTGSDGGTVLTFSAWETLDAGLDWAYHRSRPHPSAVTRQRSHGLVLASGSIRCAVRASSGSLGDAGDPLAPLPRAAP